MKYCFKGVGKNTILVEYDRTRWSMGGVSQVPMVHRCKILAKIGNHLGFWDRGPSAHSLLQMKHHFFEFMVMNS